MIEPKEKKLMKTHLTPVELELMQILWKIGQGTVHDVLKHLPKKRKLAYTSVSTMLRILEQKKIVHTKKIGRSHIYIPLLNQHVFATEHLSKIIQHAFSGSSVQLVSYLLNKDNINSKELDEIQMIINHKKKDLLT